MIGVITSEWESAKRADDIAFLDKVRAAAGDLPELERLKRVHCNGPEWRCEVLDRAIARGTCVAAR